MMITYQRVSSKWSMREPGAIFVPLIGDQLTRTCCAASLDFRTPTQSSTQKPFRMWSPSIGWTRSRVKDGSHRSCHVTTQGGFVTGARVEGH